MNSNEHPRSALVKKFLENRRAETYEINRRNRKDRGVGTLLEGYSTLDGLSRILEAGLRLHNSPKGLRNVASFALSHSVLLRGDNIREMELANLFCVTLDDEGPDAIDIPKAMVVSLLRSKTNTEGRTDFSACLRHMDVRCCSIGWIALYLFVRWNPLFDFEEFPEFDVDREWFEIKVCFFIFVTKSYLLNPFY
jgi:hypothetical protein